MAIDASIYNALAPRKSALDYANQFEQQAFQREQMGMQREQNALALQQAKQTQADDVALRNYLSGGADLNTPEGQAGLYKAAPKAAPGILKGRLELTELQAKTDSHKATAKSAEATAAQKQFETEQARRQQHLQELVGVQDLPGAMAWLDQAQASGELPPDRVAAAKQQLQANPQGFAQWKNAAIAGGFTLQQQRENEWKQREFQLEQNNELIGSDGKVNQPLVGVKAGIAAAGKSTTTVSVNTGQKGYENESKLRNDFKSEPIYKDFNDMKSAHAQITSALKQESPIADTAAATKIMKLLDPGSVVRESELGMAMAAAGKMDRLQNMVQMWANGQKLTPTQRKDFKALADELFDAAGQAYNSKRGEYAKFGKGYGLSEDVLGAPAVSPKAPAKSDIHAQAEAILRGGK